MNTNDNIKFLNNFREDLTKINCSYNNYKAEKVRVEKANKIAYVAVMLFVAISSFAVIYFL